MNGKSICVFGFYHYRLSIGFHIRCNNSQDRNLPWPLACPCHSDILTLVAPNWIALLQGNTTSALRKYNCCHLLWSISLGTKPYLWTLGWTEESGAESWDSRSPLGSWCRTDWFSHGEEVVHRPPLKLLPRRKWSWIYPPLLLQKDSQTCLISSRSLPTTPELYLESNRLLAVRSALLLSHLGLA